METKVIAYVGKIGAGKTYQMLKRMEEEKSDGHSVGIVSFADPIKQFLEDQLGLRKSGKCQGLYVISDYIDDNVYRMRLYELMHDFVMDSLFYIRDHMEDRDVFNYFNDKFDMIWGQYADELIQHIRSCHLDADSNYRAHFRRIIQLVGTEFARGMYELVWVQNLEEKILRIIETGTIQSLFVDDARFWNEVKTISELYEVDVEIWGVVAPDDIRAARRNMSHDDMVQADNHASEADVESILASIPDDRLIQNY